ncbi:hypothetical protein HYW87_00695 [Candidatus Roizmanbacteria bacterium]|nr:hypothetical protein [Candidatus Roizmanbacteria bacterium]
MDLLTYTVFSIAYILFHHCAIQINAEFKLFVMAGTFIIAGAIGWYLHSFEFALVFAVILSLIKWEN